MTPSDHVTVNTPSCKTKRGRARRGGDLGHFSPRLQIQSVGEISPGIILIERRVNLRGTFKTDLCSSAARLAALRTQQMEVCVDTCGPQICVMCPQLSGEGLCCCSGEGRGNESVRSDGLKERRGGGGSLRHQRFPLREVDLARAGASAPFDSIW